MPLKPIITKVTHTLTATSRNGIRAELYNLFLIENPGTRKTLSTYHYEVESFGNCTVELRRPGQLNKGVDFRVCTTGLMFKPTGKLKKNPAPSHEAIIEILDNYKQKYPVIYNNQIIPVLKKFYGCQNHSLSSSNLPNFIDCDGNNKPIEIVLYCVKWLFIEQDITYWNSSGRDMLYDELIGKGLI